MVIWMPYKRDQMTSLQAQNYTFVVVVHLPQPESLNTMLLFPKSPMFFSRLPCALTDRKKLQKGTIFFLPSP